jgi:hypothetical protein
VDSAAKQKVKKSRSPMKTFRTAVTALAVASLSLWSSPLAAARAEIPNASQPQLTTVADGRVFVVYAQMDESSPNNSGHGGHGDHSAHAAGHGEGHGVAKKSDAKKKARHGPGGRAGGVFVAASTDGGATFAPGVRVASLPKLMVGNRRGPRIAAHGNRLTVTAIADELVAFTSMDGGKTWSDAVTINDVKDSAHEGLHDLAVSPDGEVFVIWLDLRGAETELFGASSRDGGCTWAADQLVYKSPDKSICECCHPSALFDRDGNLAVMWRNSVEGSRDMWLTTRVKGAISFTAARKLGEGTWKINGCPHDGGTLVALGGGKFGAVWQRSGEVFLSGTDGKETKLGSGRQPVAVENDGQTIVVWNDGSGLVAVRDLARPQPTKVAPEARFPSVTALPGGKALLAYERGGKGTNSVVIERL